MKHLIKIESTPHGVLGVRHTGLDNQYCEAGETIILKWQPDAKWGLQEAHYIDNDGNVTTIDLTRVKVDGVNVVAFVMPDKDITIGGTFKRFVVQDWTDGDENSKYYQHELLENSKTIYLGENILNGVVGTGTGWSHSDGVYTHASGNTDPLVFAEATTQGEKYVAIFKSGVAGVEGSIMVSIGDGAKADMYFGNTGPFYFGMLSDGGNLKFTPATNYTSTILDVELRQVVDEADAVTSIDFYGDNVYNNEMENDITGSWNVALGTPNTMGSAQNASRCIAVGYAALSELESGERNIAVGTFALNQLIYGHKNIAIGTDSMYRVANGDDNVAVGKGALGWTHATPSDHTYNRNIAIGSGALGGGFVNANNNIGIGGSTGSGFSGSPEANTLIGDAAGYYATIHNVAIGRNAGYYITRGGDPNNGNSIDVWPYGKNVCIGNEAGSNTYVVGAANVLVGSSSNCDKTGATSSNILKSVGNVAIGHNTMVASGTSSSAKGLSIAIGYRAQATAEKSIVIGVPNNIYSDNATATGVRSLSIGCIAAASGDNSIAIGYSATAGYNDSIAIGRGCEADSAGQIKIGHTANYTQMVFALASGGFVFDLGGTQYQLVFNADNTVTWQTPA